MRPQMLLASGSRNSILSEGEKESYSTAHATLAALSPSPAMPILAAFIVATCGHGLYFGSRLGISLAGIALGASPATLGLLNACSGLMPIFLGLAIGRWVDRVGVRVPLMAAALAAILGMLAPFAWPSYAALALAALCAGLLFVTSVICTQKTVAALSAPERRVGQLGWLSAATAVGASFALVAVGVAVDHLGHRASFALAALLPAIALAALATLGRALPPGEADAPRRAKGASLALLREPDLRIMLVLSAVVPVASDTFSFIVPIIGSRLGWSASLVGVITGASFASSLAARVLLPWLSRRMGAWTLLGASYVTVTATYFALPWITLPAVMIGFSVLIGLGCGIAPPVLSALLYAASPAGRQGEVIGLRSILQFSLTTGAPLAVGALGTLVGLAPIVSAMGAAMAWAAQRSFRETGRRRSAQAPKAP